MLIVKTAENLHIYLNHNAHDIGNIGFVPTMGALHAGHISLINKSISENEMTICSIFINPTQFNDPNDLLKYPVTLDSDIQMLENAGCDILFLPSAEEIYPNGTDQLTHYDLGDIENVYEGEYRPGHFQGVCQVVDKLLQIVNPAVLYLGQKDYQQCMVISKLIELQKLKCRITICPTQREENGLAMSSRNLRLTLNNKEKAASIYKALQYCKVHYPKENPSQLIKKGISILNENGFTVDYFDIINGQTFNTVTDWKEQKTIVVIVAAFLDDVRLIDNLQLA